MLGFTYYVNIKLCQYFTYVDQRNIFFARMTRFLMNWSMKVFFIIVIKAEIYHGDSPSQNLTV